MIDKLKLYNAHRIYMLRKNRKSTVMFSSMNIWVFFIGKSQFYAYMRYISHFSAVCNIVI